MAGIHNQNQPDKLFPMAEVVAEQIDPMCAYRFGDLGITVAGQIDHKIAVLQLEEVDMLCPSRCF